MILSYGVNILFSFLLLSMSEFGNGFTLVSSVINMAVTLVFIMFLYRSEVLALADA